MATDEICALCNTTYKKVKESKVQEQKYIHYRCGCDIGHSKVETDVSTLTNSIPFPFPYGGVYGCGP